MRVSHRSLESVSRICIEKVILLVLWDVLALSYVSSLLHSWTLHQVLHLDVIVNVHFVKDSPVLDVLEV